MFAPVLNESVASRDPVYMQLVCAGMYQACTGMGQIERLIDSDARCK